MNNIFGTKLGKEELILGKYQSEWLDKYKNINLDHWRLITISKRGKIVENEWMYVGDWKPTDIEPYPSKKDGGYSQRQKNLENNTYYYWPL